MGALYVSEIEDWLGRLMASPTTREQFDQVLTAAHSPSLEECCLLLEYLEHWENAITDEARSRALALVTANTEFEEVRDMAHSIVSTWHWSRDGHETVPWASVLVLMRTLSRHVRYLGPSRVWDAASDYRTPGDSDEVRATPLVSTSRPGSMSGWRASRRQMKLRLRRRDGQ